MRVKVISEIQSAKGIIPAGQIIEIPPTVMEKLKGKVVAILPVVDNKPSTEKSAHTSNTNDPTPSEIVEPGAPVGVLWRNPYPQGTPEARRKSLKLIMDAMLYGLPPVDDEQTRRINDMVRDVLTGKAKLADLRRVLGTLH